MTHAACIPTDDIINTDIIPAVYPNIPSELVLYYDMITPILSDNFKDNLEQDCNCAIECCGTWASLVMRVSSQFWELKPSLIILGASVFLNNNVEPCEIVNALNTMYRYTQHTKMLKLAIMVDEVCPAQFIKKIQDADVQGIVPGPNFGYEKTLVSLLELLDSHYYWPKSVLDTITGKRKYNTLPVHKNGITLTCRQQEVLALVCNRGLSNKKIAYMLKISESTVKIHVSAILKSYGVRNRTQLALAASSSLKL